MPFRFALQSVLHLRQSLEHQQELRLRALNQQVARVQHAIGQIDSRYEQMRAARGQGLQCGMTAAELRFELQCEDALSRQRRDLKAQSVRLEQLRDQQRAVLQQARQARETLETVRDRQLEAYRQETGRREQRKVDDLFLMRILTRRKIAKRDDKLS
jgi:flagellar export protein FliJ